MPPTASYCATYSLPVCHTPPATAMYNLPLGHTHVTVPCTTCLVPHTTFQCAPHNLPVWHAQPASVPRTTCQCATYNLPVCQYNLPGAVYNLPVCHILQCHVLSLVLFSFTFQRAVLTLFCCNLSLNILFTFLLFYKLFHSFNIRL